MHTNTRKIRVPDLVLMKERGERIVMLTAYDATMARLFDRAGISRRQGRTRLSLQEYLYAQQFIRTGHPALGAIIRLLARA